MKKSLLFLAVLFLVPALSFSQDIELFPYQWSSYTTRFVEGSGRGENIYLAAEKLDGFILHPGSEFSFNENITWRIPRGSLGYAPAIIGGRILTAEGGGLCQVSSTLYAAALYAGLTITERRNHSLPVNYIAIGLDATVSSSQSVDLKFVNRHEFPVIIYADTSEGNLKVSLRAFSPNPFSVKVRISMPEREGDYIYTTTTRLIEKEGSVLSDEIVSRDIYIW